MSIKLNLNRAFHKILTWQEQQHTVLWHPCWLFWNLNSTLSDNWCLTWNCHLFEYCNCNGDLQRQWWPPAQISFMIMLFNTVRAWWAIYRRSHHTLHCLAVYNLRKVTSSYSIGCIVFALQLFDDNVFLLITVFDDDIYILINEGIRTDPFIPL